MTMEQLALVSMVVWFLIMAALASQNNGRWP